MGKQWVLREVSGCRQVSRFGGLHHARMQRAQLGLSTVRCQGRYFEEVLMPRQMNDAFEVELRVERSTVARSQSSKQTRRVEHLAFRQLAP